MTSLFELLLATHNRGKLVELRALLGGRSFPTGALAGVAPSWRLDLVSLETALPGRPQAAEDGRTFLENARAKAYAAASATMMVTLAEDAGLEVDVLGGRPGVRSARFARDGATDGENSAALLKALEDVDDDQRTARFRCVMVLIDPWAEGVEREAVAEGACEGRIARAPRGGGGFGYDPLFIVEDGRTMAELPDEEKNERSHRARAVAAILPALDALVARRIASVASVASVADGQDADVPTQRGRG